MLRFIERRDIDSASPEQYHSLSAYGGAVFFIPLHIAYVILRSYQALLRRHVELQSEFFTSLMRSSIKLIDIFITPRHVIAALSFEEFH